MEGAGRAHTYTHIANPGTRAWREGIYLAELLALHHRLLELLCPSCGEGFLPELQASQIQRCDLDPPQQCIYLAGKLSLRRVGGPDETTESLLLHVTRTGFSCSFLISQVSSVLSRFPMISSLEGASVPCKSPQRSQGSLRLDQCRSLVHLQSPGVPCGDRLRLGV